VPESRLTVGLETSSRIGSIALLDGDRLVAERTLGETGRQHARTLIAELDVLLSDQSISPRDVGVVAVSIGPGSFTGLRVGVVCAKTWAFVTGCRLVAVDTFAAVIEGLPPTPSAAWVIDDALRGDVFAQKFVANGSPRAVWKAEGPARLLPFETWIRETAPAQEVCGPGAAIWKSELESRWLDVAPSQFHRPTAAAVARIGARLAAEGISTDPFALVPLYIRRSAAEEKLDLQMKSGTAS
jgi:tRNA threonylcarbamoyladenosine biosynthesis protein TsaB